MKHILINLFPVIVAFMCGYFWDKSPRKVSNPHKYRTADSHYWTWDMFTPSHLFTDEACKYAKDTADRYKTYLKPSTQKIIRRIVVSCVVAFLVGYAIMSN